jgi:dolichol kinase
MPENLKPIQPQPSHASNLRDEALRRLSRSPHPYHRQRFEIQHASERLDYAPAHKSPLHSRHNTDDEEPDQTLPVAARYCESTPSDSGTEADDEHFLKGLPAPRSRPHKGLRGIDSTISASSSPLPSPAIQETDSTKLLEYGSAYSSTYTHGLKDEVIQKAAEKAQRKRNVEIIRRVSETSLLGFVTCLLCLHSDIRDLMWLWRRGKRSPEAYSSFKLTASELACQLVISMTLLVLYPLRILRHNKPSKPWEPPFLVAIPTAFDPAPLLYPPIITMLVSLLTLTNNPVGLLPTIILTICSLPKELIPSTGGLMGGNLCHWLLSCLPLLLPKSSDTREVLELPAAEFIRFDAEILILLQPLHSALCDTLHYLTTTSLLPAELQLLSISLIELLLLAASPQAVILKSLLWGCGIGILITCSHVLGWGVTLARVPKWRFRRVSVGSTRKTPSVLRMLFGGNPNFLPNRSSSVASSKSSDDEAASFSRTSPRGKPKLDLKIQDTVSLSKKKARNGSISAVDSSGLNKFGKGQAKFESSGIQRRHTLPHTVNHPHRSSKMTPSGRKKRSASANVQSFFSLTQTQASVRKWMYAGWVYACIVIIILGGIREYVARFALHSYEPIGWALGYLFGDIPQFRMEVIKANLQRWIILPDRNALDDQEFCQSGWAEHLRKTSFGDANTRLILCTYWIGIIIVGLLVVFRLSAVYEVDTRRKVFHFMMVAMLLPATYVDPTFAALALALMLSIFLLVDLFRAAQLPPLSKSLAYFLTPYVDGRDLKGPVVISHIFLLIGCAIPLWLSLGTLPRTGKNHLAGWEIPTREVSMVSGVVCVGLGDAAASLIGRRFGRHKWIWGGGKSIEGSVAFAVAVWTALVLAKLWLRIGGWPANNYDSWIVTGGKSVVAAALASLTEAVLTGGNDNVVVPVVLWLCVKGLDV